MGAGWRYRPYTDPAFGKPDTEKYQAPPFKPSSGASAFPPDPNDPNTGIKFNTSAPEVSPFVLLPYTNPANLTAGTPDTQGFLQLPAKMLEPVFRNFWASASAPASTKDEAAVSSSSKE
jgi:hypothetical protein